MLGVHTSVPQSCSFPSMSRAPSVTRSSVCVLSIHPAFIHATQHSHLHFLHTLALQHAAICALYPPVKVLHQCTLCISPCMCFSHLEQHHVVSACLHFSAQPCMHSMHTPASVSMLFNPQCCASGSCSPQGFPRLVWHHQGQYLVCSALRLRPTPSPSCVSPFLGLFLFLVPQGMCTFPYLEGCHHYWSIVHSLFISASLSLALHSRSARVHTTAPRLARIIASVCFLHAFPYLAFPSCTCTQFTI